MYNSTRVSVVVKGRSVAGHIVAELLHQHVITFLPESELMKLFKLCCLLRSVFFADRSKLHESLQNHYVFWYSYGRLVTYHLSVMVEMLSRGIKFTEEMNKWFKSRYNGTDKEVANARISRRKTITTAEYPEHDDLYLAECVLKLRGRGVDIELDDVYRHYQKINPFKSVKRYLTKTAKGGKR